MESNLCSDTFFIIVMVKKWNNSSRFIAIKNEFSLYIYILNSCKIKLLNDVHFLNLGLNSYENHVRISKGKNVHVIIYTYLSSDSYIQVQLLLIQSCIIFKLVDQKSGKFAPRGGGIAIFMKHFPKFKHCFDDTY